MNINRPIIIGDKVWFSAHTKVLKGVKLGNNMVIAEGTILCKSFETSNIVVGGNPLRILKENIIWDV